MDQQTYLPVEMQLYISMMFLGLPDDIHEDKPSFSQLKKTHYGPTKRPMDGRTDRPSYRDARTHLKKGKGKGGKINKRFLIAKKSDLERTFAMT